ncbi:MAG: hypothetical protein EOO45_05690 [Flavobacterium sp.]|nr:MAG: hypothetical protein EOO45_05690 [Flavobacterium sp.]
MEKDLNNDRDRELNKDRVDSRDGLAGKISQDPINQREVDSFPPEKENPNPDIDAERDTNLVNKRSPVRDGRNIGELLHLYGEMLC